jgi:hypothetical protein
MDARALNILTRESHDASHDDTPSHPHGQHHGRGRCAKDGQACDGTCPCAHRRHDAQADDAAHDVMPS